MRENILSYKGYLASIEYSAEDGVLWGKVEGISDGVTFEAYDAETIVSEFHHAVDSYLLTCKELGKEPEKAYSGNFNIRIKPEHHREIARIAFYEGLTINAEVEKAITAYVAERSASLNISVA